MTRSKYLQLPEGHKPTVRAEGQVGIDCQSVWASVGHTAALGPHVHHCRKAAAARFLPTSVLSLSSTVDEGS